MLGQVQVRSVISIFSRNSSLRDVRYAKKRIFGLDNTELERSKQNTFNISPEEDGTREDSANVSRCQRISSYTKVRRVVGPA